jgi:hypothetical protein
MRQFNLLKDFNISASAGAALMEFITAALQDSLVSAVGISVKLQQSF